jgi:hypothetical protein
MAILVVLWNEDRSLRILVHPELRTIVQGDDWVYLESLLKDFRARAELDPDALFKQISSLNVGPLVTKDVGSKISDHPSLLELCSHFVQL